MDRILVPVDFSTCSRRALEYARAIAEPENAEIHLLHVFSSPSGASADRVAIDVPERGRLSLSELAYSRAAKEIEAFVAANDAADVTTHLLPGSPGRRILEFAEQGRFDLIVMGTHGRTGIRRLIMGSVAEHVVRHAVCPVLSIHPNDDRRPGDDETGDERTPGGGAGGAI